MNWKLFSTSIASCVVLMLRIMKLQVVLSINYSSADKRYDLGEVGRYKINRKLELELTRLRRKYLTKEDIIEIIKYLVRLNQW